LYFAVQTPRPNGGSSRYVGPVLGLGVVQALIHSAHSLATTYFCNHSLRSALAAMSFDQYFEGAKQQQAQSSNDSDDWYGIVEQALYDADLASHRYRQQAELNLMKPLPIIPEDDSAVEEPQISNSMHNPSRRPSSVYSKASDAYSEQSRHDTHHAVQQASLSLQRLIEESGSRRPSSDLTADFDSPLSSESNALDDWGSRICSPRESSMGSLRSKPYTRKSSSTGSAVSCRSASVGSSVMAGRSGSRSSSIYSTDTSVDSTKSVGVHSRHMSTASSSEAKSEEEPAGSFFDFSDDEEETESQSAMRRDSSASSYVRHLRKAALSFRMATSRRAPKQQAKTLSTPTTADVSALSAWLLRASLVGRNSSSPTSEEMESEGQLMVDAAESAKARRVSGDARRR
jgi:hypothetical protein